MCVPANEIYRVILLSCVLTLLFITGDILPVSGTVFDLTQPTRLGDVLNNVTVDNIAMGYDHNYCIRGAPGVKKVARYCKYHTQEVQM